MSQSTRTEKPSQNLRGEKIGSQALSSLTLHLLHLAPFLSHAHRRETQTFMSPPRGKRVNVPLILRSEDQSQQGSHVCQIRKSLVGYANMGATVHARAPGWIENKRVGGKMKRKPCYPLQWKRLKYMSKRRTEREHSASSYPPESCRLFCC